ncbi:tetratricopeptide repeat protein [Sphingobium yanoikuyae]|uniref:tetratricopeptide repeat protein n=1 Tax=Sphingobium yanoikuyae TaxID=13690 RepID=UPI002FDB4292
MLFLSWLLASAATLPLVQVAPADPTALFKGDGNALKFDPACRDYNIDTVQTNPDCAARIANGEAAPSLAIAASTFQSLPAKSDDAIKMLEHSASVTDSPAVHYLLGSVLGTAEYHQPNYGLAVQHLGIAAQRGNPAAADLLATLLIAGKGAPRDVPRAINLYATAAANGFPVAAVTLGKLYLAGKFVPKDEAKGVAWLDAAAAVNTPGAAQLAALAKNQGKISNFQLVPSSEPAKVKAVRYGTFDNPDIPPNFGFDQEFQSIHDAPYDDAATLARLEKEAASLPTPYLYELARRLAARDPSKSFQTYLVARTRLTYDASRCADPAALEGLRAWDMVVAPDIRFLFVAGRPSSSVVNDALAEEAKLPANVEPWWVCRSGVPAMTAAMNGAPGPLMLKPTSEWPMLRTAAQMRLRGMAGAQ